MNTRSRRSAKSPIAAAVQIALLAATPGAAVLAQGNQASDLMIDEVIVTARKRNENARPVRTASSEQVRRPIYRKGVDHWKNFEAHLEPLADVLGPATPGRFSGG